MLLALDPITKSLKFGLIGFLYIDEFLNKTLKLLESSFSFIKIEKNLKKRFNFTVLKLNFIKQS